jgi:choline dehydrogenase-like flavoprotein
VEAGPDYRTADMPAAMTSPNPFQILRDPEFSLFRWDEVQSRRTAQQMPYQYCRGRGVGGSSAINGQIAIRGVVEDFDDWAENGCEGWAFADVLPSFNRLESDMRFGARSYHGGDGPIPIYRAPISRWGAVDQGVAEAALDAGYGWEADHNAPGAIGVSPYAITSRDNKRVSTNEAYVEPARGRANLEIFGDTLVDKIIFSGDRASGLRVITRGEQRTILRSCYVPVSDPSLTSARSACKLGPICRWAKGSRIILLRSFQSNCATLPFRNRIFVIQMCA